MSDVAIICHKDDDDSKWRYIKFKVVDETRISAE